MRDGCVEIGTETNKHLATGLGIGKTKVYLSILTSGVGIDL